MDRYKASELSSHRENREDLLQASFSCPKCKNIVHYDINLFFDEKENPQKMIIHCECGYEFEVVEG
ncbi:hypothetical protein [Desulfovibrio piger]|uniref:hypothetical protein n=1 Tax=Desulfovibrio piger TaxID=901 RepID=UPI0026F2D8BC|nr:hypothetical protein [Desulfovibrio piger]